ncbi:MAG: VacB/RNase II family 3'-5' exoribonuclease, partial [Proteobacteria bacterium]|nr:VacB/RNase II family 3'-5' exoribonuclease [Pseudomonadota bacterium]
MNSSRYRHPIPSRPEIINAMERAGRPLTLVSLAGHLRLKGSRNEGALRRRLKAMVRDGQLIRNRAREYCLAHHLDLVIGRVRAHKDGYGFLTPDSGEEDIFLSSREMGRLWGGDRVAARISVTHRGSEGRVVEILERAVSEVAGRLVSDRGIDWVEVEGRERTRVLIPGGQGRGAKEDDLVRAEITAHPTRRTNAIGRVIHVLGDFDDPGAQTLSVILSHGIPYEFSLQVEAEAAEMPSGVTPDARRGRKDLRKLPLVTIDGADAKDFDDAVYCEPNDNGWRLIVAIADVGQYVRPETGLDEAARERGTSVYFPDRVVPMLPETLSNGLCSLQPRQDRLCLCCDMTVSRQGEVRQSRFYEAVMRSVRRFTYGEAARVLSGESGNDNVPAADSATFRSLKALADVYAAFLARRCDRGGLEFNPSEVVLELDDRGRISSIAPRQRLVTHRIIEECMIAANVEAAKWLRKARIPSLYRVHEGPGPERVDELILFLRTLGITSVSPGRLQPADMNRILKATASGPEAELVETMLLRCMARAEYRPKNNGHFGLALPAYAHFTSPIR